MNAAQHRPLRALAWRLCALACALASPAHAVDGVIEINQARANKGGITPGDAPGLPITISTGAFASEPMSFRLTGPLTNSTSANVIEITSPYVTVDLNGFAITCLLASCTGKAISSSSTNVTVRNGTIRGFAEGVSLTGSGARVESIRAIGNGTGLAIGSDCLVRNNIANTSTAEGIRVENGCTVVGNTANNNGTDGICTLQGTNVIGNTVRNNSGHGLNLALGAGYSGNVIQANTMGTVTGGTAAGQNVCNGSPTCP